MTIAVVLLIMVSERKFHLWFLCRGASQLSYLLCSCRAPELLCLAWYNFVTELRLWRLRSLVVWWSISRLQEQFCTFVWKFEYLWSMNERCGTVRLLIGVLGLFCYTTKMKLGDSTLSFTRTLKPANGRQSQWERKFSQAFICMSSSTWIGCVSLQLLSESPPPMASIRFQF